MTRWTVNAASADLDGVAAQLPAPETQAPGTRVVLFASAPRSWLGALLSRDTAAPIHVLCTALLARGYTRIGAGQEDGRACAWGHAEGDAKGEPEPTEPSASP